VERLQVNIIGAKPDGQTRDNAIITGHFTNGTDKSNIYHRHAVGFFIMDLLKKYCQKCIDLSGKNNNSFSCLKNQ